MDIKPRLFLGRVMHRRLRPVVHGFVYPVFYMQLPLHDLAAAKGPFFAVDRNNLLSFQQADHGPRDGSALLPWIQKLLAQRGLPSDGPVILQTFPRVLGYVFNPVSFWFCQDGEGRLIAVLAEVNNTFGEHHLYLLHHPDGRAIQEGDVFQASKAFHVSPFCDVVGEYRFRFYVDRDKPLVCIDYSDAAGKLLLTAISGRPLAWSTANLLRTYLKMPLMTLGVIARIHWQALRLWLKGVPFFGTRPPALIPPLSESQ